MSESSKVKDAADALKALSESVPVYRDAIQPGAVQIGKAAETLGKVVNVALAPLRLVVWGYDQIEDFLTKRISEELEDVPEGQIITPDLNVAGPAVEALKFAGHKEELREMYARLLARAMDSSTASRAHPAFVEIIKQITSDEALMLDFISGSTLHPVVTLKSKDQDEDDEFGTKARYTERFRLFSLIGISANCLNSELSPTYLENLARLKIIDIRQLSIANEAAYDPLEEHSLLDPFRLAIESEGLAVDFDRYVVSMTEFGKQFYSICVGK